MDNSYILVVEDDPDIREMIAEVLESENYLVKTASNGLEAMLFLEKSAKPKLILLDLMMPVADGIWFCTERQKHPDLKTIPVVVISADRKAAAKTDGLSVNEVLAKPIKIEDLVRVVEKVAIRA